MVGERCLNEVEEAELEVWETRKPTRLGVGAMMGPQAAEAERELMTSPVGQRTRGHGYSVFSVKWFLLPPHAVQGRQQLCATEQTVSELWGNARGLGPLPTLPCAVPGHRQTPGMGTTGHISPWGGHWPQFLPQPPGHLHAAGHCLCVSGSQAHQAEDTLAAREAGSTPPFCQKQGGQEWRKMQQQAELPTRRPPGNEPLRAESRQTGNVKLHERLRSHLGGTF